MFQEEKDVIVAPRTQNPFSGFLWPCCKFLEKLGSSDSSGYVAVSNLQYFYPEFPQIERHSRVGHTLVYQWVDPGSGLSDAQVCGELEMHV